jgi:MinD-like ATPase involved in chromosome partitioning or flagellar assembly
VTTPLTVLTAVTGDGEAPLVRGLERHRDRLTVVRRCADVADVLATAGSGRARAAVVSADLRGLDGDTVARLTASGCAVVALTAPDDEWSERRLRQLGVTSVLGAGATSEEVAAAVQAAVGLLGDGVPPTAPAPLPAPRGVDADDVTADGSAGDGRVVAVWGPPGAPGRTTTAVNLAAELAGAGHSTLLVDADTYAASVSQVLGLLDEAPGVAAAARAADHGSLDLPTLSRLAPEVGPALRVLTGLAAAHRWPELRPSSLSRVLHLARSLVRWAVVDVAACLEEDEELVYDTAAPRRNAATRTTLEEADVVLAVGSADPVGLQRLVRGLDELAALGRRADTVVVTRLRATAVGSRSGSTGGPARRVTEALERYAGVHGVLLVPDDVPTMDAALLAGRTLLEAAPGSPCRIAYRDLARTVLGEPPADEQRTRRARRRTVRA